PAALSARRPGGSSPGMAGGLPATGQPCPAGPAACAPPAEGAAAVPGPHARGKAILSRVSLPQDAAGCARRCLDVARVPADAWVYALAPRHRTDGARSGGHHVI